MSRSVNVVPGPLGRARRILGHELVRDVVVPFVVHRTLLVAIGLGAMRIFPNVIGFHTRAAPVVDAFIRWDAIYYMQVAQDGYGGRADAFFPVFPALVRVVALAMPLAYAAVLVAHVASVGALALLHRWVRGAEGRVVARRAVVLALLFPTSFFLGAPYAESTYLVFLVGAFVAHRSERSMLAALCVGLACLARPQGFVCATLPFVVEWLASRPKSLRGAPWFVLGAGVALVALLGVHWAASGDPLGFLHARTVQSLGAFRDGPRVAPPPFHLVLWDEGFSANLVRRILNWSALALVGTASIALARRRKLAEATVCVLSMLVPLYFHRTLFDAASMARYALLAFPIFGWLATARIGADGRRYLDTGLAMAQLVLFCAFTGWYWAE